MTGELKTALASPAELMGNLSPLAEQLGSPEGATTFGAVTAFLQCPRVQDLPSLRCFLDTYRTEVLVTVELPAIQRAFQHASRYEARELIALDQQLAREPRLQPFADASAHLGRNQLCRFRPMRDQRLVKRYISAVETGQAAGFHTLVYGLMCALFSLPLRQSLLAYARQTLTGFANAAARPLGLSEPNLQALLDSTCEGLPAAVDPLVAPASEVRFRES